jgi:hypothetical protein
VSGFRCQVNRQAGIDKIDLDLGISVFESKNGFPDTAAWLPVDCNLAFFFTVAI